MKTMTFLIIGVHLLLTSPVYGAVEIVRCLAQEEALFHKNKNTGPIFELNQKMISELTQLIGTDAIASIRKQICSSPSPSWFLLKNVMINPSTWYEIDPKTMSEQPHLSKELVRDFNEIAFTIFISFIQSLQVDAPTAGCIEKKIPEIGKLFKKIKYLQEEIDQKDIIPNKTEIKNIFNSLKDPQKLYLGCKKNQKKKV